MTWGDPPSIGAVLKVRFGRASRHACLYVGRILRDGKSNQQKNRSKKSQETSEQHHPDITFQAILMGLWSGILISWLKKDPHATG